MDQPNPTQPTGLSAIAAVPAERKTDGRQRDGRHDAQPGGSVPTRGRFPLLDRVAYPEDLRNLSVE
ncbi:hypothetical protein, partial [Gluconacetobacter diazotrophicus]